MLTNRAGRGRKGSIVAIVDGIESESVIKAIQRIPHGKRRSVKEITMDMSKSMCKIA